MIGSIPIDILYLYNGDKKLFKIIFGVICRNFIFNDLYQLQTLSQVTIPDNHNWNYSLQNLCGDILIVF